MSDDVSTTQALAIIRPAVLPSLAQFGIERDLAVRLASARGFLPDHYFTGDGVERAAKVLAAIEYGRAVGIEPMIALQNLHMIDGKVGATALLIGAQLRRAGYKIAASWYDDQGTAVPKESPKVHGCKIVLTKGAEVTGDGVFSLTDASRANLLNKSNWKNYPKDMMYARALTQAAREGGQDAVLGMAYTAEELGAEVEFNGEVETVRLPPMVQDQAIVLDGEVIPAAAPGVSEAAGSPPTAAIQPAPPAPSVEESPAAFGDAAGAEEPAKPTPPPPSAGPVTPLGGPAFARRMGAGRSVGPAPKRQNVVTVEQGAEKPATAPEVPTQPTTSEQPVPSQPAPPGLIDDPVAAEPVDDGLDVQRELVRATAAELAHVNMILRNTLEHAIKGEAPEPVPPATPNPVADEGIARRIDTDWPGRTLANLGAEDIQNLLERFDASLSKKRALMLERGITEE